MPKVFSTLHRPDGTPPPHGAKITVSLVDPTHHEPITGAVASATTFIQGEAFAYADALGHWEMILTPNTLITPSGCVYLVSTDMIRGSFYGDVEGDVAIVVPSGAGPYWIGDIIA